MLEKKQSCFLHAYVPIYHVGIIWAVAEDELKFWHALSTIIQEIHNVFLKLQEYTSLSTN